MCPFHSKANFEKILICSIDTLVLKLFTGCNEKNESSSNLGLEQFSLVTII